MTKALSIVLALVLGFIGLFCGAAALVAFLYGTSNEMPAHERPGTLIAGAFFALLTLGCLGGGLALVVRAFKRP